MSVDKERCKECGTEFELKPGKPGFANVCPQCSEPSADSTIPEIKADVREFVADKLRHIGKSNAEVEKIISVMAEQPDSWYLDVLNKLSESRPKEFAEMRRIQQLFYDESKNRLFCPDHPDYELEEAQSNTGFCKICRAPLGIDPATKILLTCMKSAEWQSREDMNRELGGGL